MSFSIESPHYDSRLAAINALKETSENFAAWQQASALRNRYLQAGGSPNDPKYTRIKRILSVHWTAWQAECDLLDSPVADDIERDIDRLEREAGLAPPMPRHRKYCPPEVAPGAPMPARITT